MHVFEASLYDTQYQFFSAAWQGTASGQCGSEQNATRSSPFLCVVDALKTLRYFFTADGQMKGRDGEGKRRVQ